MALVDCNVTDGPDAKSGNMASVKINVRTKFFCFMVFKFMMFMIFFTDDINSYKSDLFRNQTDQKFLWLIEEM
jgi:hypothetical protein